MRLQTPILFAIAVCLGATPALAGNHKDKHKHKRLPPGLQKKLERGGELPPGWERKLARGEIMEQPIYEQSEVVIPVDEAGHVTVRVEDKLVRMIDTTREILDVVELLNR